MSKIQEKQVDGIAVKTATSEIVDFNILTVEAGTNGKQGGDAGHGCRAYLRIRNDASTYMKCRTSIHRIDVDPDGRCHHSDDMTEHGQVDEIEIILGGDSELDTFIEALEFAVEALRKQRDGK